MAPSNMRKRLVVLSGAILLAGYPYLVFSVLSPRWVSTLNFVLLLGFAALYLIGRQAKGSGRSGRRPRSR